MATTRADFAAVEAAFERINRWLGADSNDHAPSPCTWYAPTLEALAEEVGDLWPDGLADGEFDPERHPANIVLIGPNDGETIAWIYECNGRNLYRITAGAAVEQIERVFRECLGFGAVDVD